MISCQTNRIVVFDNKRLESWLVWLSNLTDNVEARVGHPDFGSDFKQIHIQSEL